MDSQNRIDCLQEQQLAVTITRIRWERILLHLDAALTFAPDADPTMELEYFAVAKDGSVGAQFDAEPLDSTAVRLTLNITNPGTCRMLAAGSYRILVCCGEQILAQAAVEPNFALDHLADCTRNFHYAKMNGLYSVSFRAEAGIGDLPLVLEARCGKAQTNSAEQHAGLHPKAQMQRYLKKNFRRTLRWMYQQACRQHSKKKGVLFLTEQGSQLSSNLTAVSGRMVQRKLDKQYKLLYSARPASEGSQSMKSWAELIRKLAQAKFVFLDDHAPFLDWLELSKDTIVIQLWHGGAGFKAAGYSRWGHMGATPPFSCHRQYTYGIAGSRQIAPFFSEVWGINPQQVLPTGMPRMDLYLKENHRSAAMDALRAEFPICRDKKVVLFAPTFRGRNRAEANYPYEVIDFDGLARVCGDDTVVLFKMHPWVKEPVPIPPQYADRFADAGDYPEINDLFYLADLLITDYSSNIYEYALMNRPMLFFAFDEASYGCTRGFYGDYETAAPGKVCRTFAQLLTAMEQQDYDFHKSAAYNAQHFEHIDSGAADRVIDWMLLDQMPEDLRAAIAEQDARTARWQSLVFPAQP